VGLQEVLAGGAGCLGRCCAVKTQLYTAHFKSTLSDVVRAFNTRPTSGQDAWGAAALAAGVQEARAGSGRDGVTVIQCQQWVLVLLQAPMQKDSEAEQEESKRQRDN
jgi:hypothetical protein